jgi:hypothetical protein
VGNSAARYGSTGYKRVEIAKSLNGKALENLFFIIMTLTFQS